MNWDMLGALAELVGAVGVIWSLLYLATQVRSGARATRRANAHSLNEGARSWWSLIARNTELASLLQRGLAGYKDLEATERLQFSSLILQVATLWEEWFYAHRDGDVLEWAGEPYGLGMRELTSLPGFHQWYAERGHFLSADFRNLVEKSMASEADKIATHFTSVVESDAAS